MHRTTTHQGLEKFGAVFRNFETHSLDFSSSMYKEGSNVIQLARILVALIVITTKDITGYKVLLTTQV